VRLCLGLRSALPARSFSGSDLLATRVSWHGESSSTSCRGTMRERSLDAGASRSAGQREEWMTRPWDERGQAFDEGEGLEGYCARAIFPSPLELVDDAAVESE